MKRLTYRDANGEAWYSDAGTERDRLHRLAAIEDILCDGTDEYDLDRLSVLCNQRMTMREEVSQRFSLTANIPLDRLRELAEADREGRCVVLDVKIGQKVWILDAGEYGDDDEAYPLELNINGITLSDEHEIYYFIESPLGMDIDPFSHKDIGKTVFLTRTEAEAALAKIATDCD